MALPLEWKYAADIKGWRCFAAEAKWELTAAMTDGGTGRLWSVWRDRELLGLQDTLVKAKAYAEKRHQNCAELRIG